MVKIYNKTWLNKDFEVLTWCTVLLALKRTCGICTSLAITIGAFTLAGISGIPISVFASRSKSWDFYKCGHKNLTNYRDQHRAANRNTSCDYLGISAIVCIAADVWTLEQIILVFSIPSFQASVSKQGQCLISGMRSSVTRIIPLSDLQDISACLAGQAQKYLSISIAMEISDFSCVWMRLMM